MKNAQRILLHCFEKIYQHTPSLFKESFSRDFRTKVKILLRYSEFQDDLFRKIFLLVEELRLYMLNHAYSKAQESIESLQELQRQKQLETMYDGEIRYYKAIIKSVLAKQPLKPNTELESPFETTKKCAIVSAITANYDTIRAPLSIIPGVDYILFSEHPIKAPYPWKVRPFEYHSHDPTLKARYVKTHPHFLLPEYDYVLWVDANIVILKNLSPMLTKFINSSQEIGVIKHPVRKNVFEEADACIKMAKGSSSVIKKQMNLYKKQGFTHNDLVETGVLISQPKSQKTQTFFNHWWTQIQTHSKRDQLSFNH